AVPVRDMGLPARTGGVVRMSGVTILNLTDDHRRLQLQHRKDDPAVLCALLHVQGRKVAFATADLARCRFSRDSDGEVLFWVGSTNFTICGSEFEHIEEFLAQCRREAVPLLNAETLVSGRMNREDAE